MVHARNQTVDIPFILRPEPFGGIVFDPFDGTLLELDHEAYAVARKTLMGNGFFFNRAKRNMMFELRRSLKINRFRSAREVQPTRESGWESVIDVPSLSAPTLVDFQITDKCLMGCPHCYASSVPEGQHVAWDDIQMVIEQLHDCGVCQLAIGGGEPLLHPNIIDLLKLCHEKGIVPNLTTGGMEFTDENLDAIRRYCGAVGISMEGVGDKYSEVRHHRFDKFEDSLDRMRAAGIPTVIQVTLSAANLDQVDDIVDFALSREDLYGVIFLAYKPVGRGETYSQTLASLPPDHVSHVLGSAFKRLSAKMRVGYDCCMTPGVAGVEAAMAFADESNLEGCSALRGSVGISTSLDVIPCTFTWRHKIGNLKDLHLQDIWQHANAERFRGRIQQKSTTNASCGNCSKGQNCYGGCPVMPLINCHRDHIADPAQEWVY